MPKDKIQIVFVCAETAGILTKLVDVGSPNGVNLGFYLSAPFGGAAFYGCPKVGTPGVFGMPGRAGTPGIAKTPCATLGQSTWLDLATGLT